MLPGAHPVGRIRGAGKGCSSLEPGSRSHKGAWCLADPPVPQLRAHGQAGMPWLGWWWLMVSPSCTLWHGCKQEARTWKAGTMSEAGGGMEAVKRVRGLAGEARQGGAQQIAFLTQAASPERLALRLGPRGRPEDLAVRNSTRARSRVLQPAPARGRISGCRSPSSWVLWLRSPS